MTSLLPPAAVYSKAAGKALDGENAYQKLSDDATLFPSIRHKYMEAKNAGRQADVELLWERLGDINCLAKSCAGPWPQAMYVRKA